MGTGGPRPSRSRRSGWKWIGPGGWGAFHRSTSSKARLTLAAVTASPSWKGGLRQVDSRVVSSDPGGSPPSPPRRCGPAPYPTSSSIVFQVMNSQFSGLRSTYLTVPTGPEETPPRTPPSVSYRRVVRRTITPEQDCSPTSPLSAPLPPTISRLGKSPPGARPAAHIRAVGTTTPTPSAPAVGRAAHSPRRYAVSNRCWMAPQNAKVGKPAKGWSERSTPTRRNDGQTASGQGSALPAVQPAEHGTYQRFRWSGRGLRRNRTGDPNLTIYPRPTAMRRCAFPGRCARKWCSAGWPPWSRAGLKPERCRRSPACAQLRDSAAAGAPR